MHETRFSQLPKHVKDDFIDARVQLALAVVRKLKEKRETRACILDDITIGSLDDVPSGPVTNFFRSIRNTLDFDFEDENEGHWAMSLPLFMYSLIVAPATLLQ